MNSEHPMTDRVVYRSLMADNLRWDALQLRDGDIIISAPSKSGLTWTQRLVSLLVFDGPDLPGPLSTVSPWLDQTIRPIEEVVATLDAQQHRRFIKTHTPLDGLVLDDRVSYICVGRDPRDAAVSMLYQSANMNEDRMRILHEAVVPFHERIAPPPVCGTRSCAQPDRGVPGLDGGAESASPWHRFHTSEGDRHSGQHPAPARHGMGPPSPTQRGLVSLRRLPGGLGGRAAPAGKGPRYRRDPRSSPGPGAVRHAGCDALPRVRNRS
ncbi:glycolipid sulfotransferase [Mycobacterium tuberculosis variant bovis BCG]|nr:glycolipid sulfotransferase [Mycobacterium tuberculosis variant bovis BCG]